MSMENSKKQVTKDVKMKGGKVRQETLAFRISSLCDVSSLYKGYSTTLACRMCDKIQQMTFPMQVRAYLKHEHFYHLGKKARR